MSIFVENFSAFSCEKNFVPSPHLALITPSAQQRTKMVGESWIAFTIS